MTMIESTNLEISNTQNDAVHPIRSGVLNALISGLKLILIPTDCSDHSRISIKYGIRLAQESNATIKLICVQESFDSDEDQEIASESAEGQNTRACTKLKQFWESFQKEIPCELEVRKGDVVSEVINAAKKEACDLIIMSSHGYKGLIYSMKGSTTEKVTRYAPCPVLCVKNEGRQFIA